MRLSPNVITNMQSHFISSYITNGFNATQACRDAGYSEIYAKTRSISLLDKPAIKKQIAKAFDRAEHRLTLTWEWKLNILRRIIVSIIPEDETLPIKTEHIKSAIAAIAELNKMHGDYAPEKRLSMTVDATQSKLLEARLEYKEY